MPPESTFLQNDISSLHGNASSHWLIPFKSNTAYKYICSVQVRNDRNSRSKSVTSSGPDQVENAQGPQCVGRRGRGARCVSAADGVLMATVLTGLAQTPAQTDWLQTGRFQFPSGYLPTSSRLHSLALGKKRRTALLKMLRIYRPLSFFQFSLVGCVSIYLSTLIHSIHAIKKTFEINCILKKKSYSGRTQAVNHV